MNSYFNQSDFNPGGKYGPDAEAMQDLMDQASPFNVANKPFKPEYNSRDKAIEKSLSWLAGGKNKYRAKAEESNPSDRFAQNRNTSGGGSLQPLGKDSVIWMPSQGQPITVAGGQSSGGGLGSALGSAAGFAAGMLIPGAQPFTPQLMALGGNIGGSIG
jgi:hypothetical protein